MNNQKFGTHITTTCSMVAYKAGLRWKDKQARTVMRIYMKEMVNNRAIRSKS